MGLIPFEPSLLGKGQHFQTISASLLSTLPGYMPKRIGLLNERVVLPTLDETGDCLAIHVHRYVEDHGHAKPVVVLMHGLEGDSTSVYLIKLADKILRAGFNVIRVNMRTCGESRNIATNAYYAGLTIDLAVILEFARKHVSDHVAVLGFSLGANVTIKLLGEDHDERLRQISCFTNRKIRLSKRKKNLADVFVAISPPLDFEFSCEYLDSPNCTLYRNMFLDTIKKRVIDKKFNHHNIKNTEQFLLNIHKFFDFDHHFTAPHAGFGSAMEYYSYVASKNYIRNINIPGLVLHAKDDPLIHMCGWEEAGFDSLPNIETHLTEYGGHVGWIAKKHAMFPDRRWMDYRVLHYLSEWRDSL